MPVRVGNAHQVAAGIRAITRSEKAAMRRAIDQTATASVRAFVSKAAEITQAKEAALRKRIRVVERTKQDQLTATVVVSAMRLAVKDFNPTITRTGGIVADISGQPGAGPVLLRYAFHPTGKGKGRKKGRRLETGRRKTWSKGAIFERVPQGGVRVGRMPIRLALAASAAGILMPHLDKLLAEVGITLNQKAREQITKALEGAPTNG